MTYKELKEIIEKNNVPEDIAICSNSGWECGATDVEAIYYSASKNEIHLTQKSDDRDYDEDSLLEDDKKAHDWVLLTSNTDDVKRAIWKTNFDILQTAFDLACPISLNICGDSERYTGYITEVDPIKGTFIIGMPDEFEKKADIMDAAKIDLDIHSKIQIAKGQKYKLWLDDIRAVPEGYFGAKSVNEAIRIIELIEHRGGIIELLDLDHDLGSFAKFGGDAIKLLDYLCERETYYPIAIHTANPVGRTNMERMIQRYWT